MGKRVKRGASGLIEMRTLIVLILAIALAYLAFVIIRRSFSVVP